jgi:hypothetical protein
LCIIFDSSAEEPVGTASWLMMNLELAAVLLGAYFGGIALIYAAARGYLGHRKAKVTSAVAPLESYTPVAAPASEMPVRTEPMPSPVPEQAPAPAPAMYETVQPEPAPVTYAQTTTASFEAPLLTRTYRPTRGYRRRTAPIRRISPRETRLTKPKRR